MTAEEKRVCDKMKLSYESFLRSRAEQDNGF